MIRAAILFLLLLVACVGGVSAQGGTAAMKVEPADGFSYPYYLYVPPAMRERSAGSRTLSLLVMPNNSGKLDDDLAVHEADVKRRIQQAEKAFEKLGVAILMPVFPRPKTYWKIYTHALDRDAMLTDRKEYKRFDLQLLAMIENARKALRDQGIKVDEKVLMYGFSAAGMFVDRFAFLHPKSVKAAAVGAPGGWPIAPASSYDGKPLRYPLGVSDLKAVAGRKLDLKALRKVPFFVFMGEKDDNDSLVFTDGYEPEDKELVFPLFGATPIARWEKSKELYKQSGLSAEFKLYPDTPHKVTMAMIEDIQAFFAKHLN
ncbi:MAG: hypothetical protein UZ17_ACD001000092 [Acidobacteria bacterium OLB17]|nr:MAG: hypothetical protein UZ17_ACD001000092 [Acidobacteria bacterium OLB17]